MRNFVIVIAILGILFVPAAAKADTFYDNFNGTSNVNWFSAGDGASNAALTPGGGSLNFSVSGLPADGHGYAAKVSDFTVDFSNDFKFTTQVNQSVIGGIGSKATGLDFGLMRVINGTPPPTIQAYSSVLWTGSERVVDFYIDQGNTSLQLEKNGSGILGTPASAWVGFRYTASQDLLDMGIFTSDPYSDPNANPFNGVSINNFIATYGPGPMNVYFSGWSRGPDVNTGESQFADFKGSVAPEPVSTVLFLLGGATLAVRRLRKGSKA